MRKHGRMARLASLLLALYMAFGTAPPAFADLFAFVTSEEAEIERPATSAELNGGDGTYALTVEYDEKAGLPEDVTLAAREILPSEDAYGTYYGLALEAAAVKEEEVLFARFFDIAIEGGDGKVQPESAVGVKIAVDELAELPEDAEISVLHFPDNDSENENAEDELLEEPLSLRKAPLKAMSAPMKADSAEIVKSNGAAAISEPEAVEAEVSEDGAVVFETDGFSVYWIVGTIETTVLASDGRNYRITAAYGVETGIPMNAELAVDEISDISELYDEYVSKAEKALGMEVGSAGYIRLFDISIVKQGDPSVKYQPAPGTAVDVRIALADSDSHEMNVVHFADDCITGDVIDAAVNGQIVSFDASGFSIFACHFNYFVRAE